jgi:hypothetical protein
MARPGLEPGTPRFSVVPRYAPNHQFVGLLCLTTSRRYRFFWRFTGHRRTFSNGCTNAPTMHPANQGGAGDVGGGRPGGPGSRRQECCPRLAGPTARTTSRHCSRRRATTITATTSPTARTGIAGFASAIVRTAAANAPGSPKPRASQPPRCGVDWRVLAAGGERARTGAMLVLLQHSDTPAEACHSRARPGTRVAIPSRVRTAA